MNPDETRIGGAGEAFQPTRWSIVLSAGDPRSSAYQESLDYLTRAYWRPVYAYLRRRGHSIEDAKDLTQDFFEVALRRNLPGRAERREGKFRTFLLASVQNFLRDARDRESAARHGGGWNKVELDLADDLGIVGPGSETPEETYDRRWALDLLQGSLGDLRRHYAAGGKDLHYRLFERYVDLLVAGRPVGYPELAGEFGCSVSDVTNYLHRARLLYRELLRARIRESVARPEEVEEEVRELFGFLG